MDTSAGSSKAILRTYFDGPDKAPVEDIFRSLRECFSIATMRSKEGYVVEIERVGVEPETRSTPL